MEPYYAEKGFGVYLADSLVLLEALEPESVDMVFADPPYNLSNGEFTVHAGKRVPVHEGSWDVSKGFEQDSAFHRVLIAWLRLPLHARGGQNHTS